MGAIQLKLIGDTGAPLVTRLDPAKESVTAGVVPPSRPRRNIGKQKALFNDTHVRRDNFQSKQWCEQHMRIKVHLTGFACAYEHIDRMPTKRDSDRPAIAGRYQGSLFSQQKHSIADAIEWMRLNCKYKPRIFVATTPGFLDHAKEGKFISDLVHNLKNGYGMENYVWVRELTKNGYPHFHFVADIDDINWVRLSEFWSGLFGSDAKNSIRCGTKPYCSKCRRLLRSSKDFCCNRKATRDFWIKNSRMCWYLTKYIGKSIGDAERPGNKKAFSRSQDDPSAQITEIKPQRRKFRTFAISQEARKKSAPLVYHEYHSERITGFRDRIFHLPMDTVGNYLDLIGCLPPTSVNPRNFSWRWTTHGQTYIGFQKKQINTS